MLEAIIWGFVQGVTEFLPISSDGHLVLVPAFLGIDPPDLATTAVLHLGTLAAVLAYFWKDLIALVKFRSDPDARRLLTLIVIGSLPAGLALLVVDEIERLQKSVTATAVFLITTGVVLAVASRLRKGDRTIADGRATDAVLIGFAQLSAILPGISRSGMTIATGVARGFDQVEAARFSFLLGIPAVAAAGLLELGTLLTDGGVPATAWVGVLVAAATGYGAIAFLLKMLARTGLAPYALYCVVVGVVALVVL
ncbi:MAG TPA: undecaprenyl-diphosphate phosphatase [Acidimicrobiia bacterium]|nr:undecaprenyl-diphosphate phosphatase [Acidimicrobiia bacterium]